MTKAHTLSYHDHSRGLDGNRYIYTVLSRRSGGVSIGINLNPDKVCNFDCVYCQVDRTSPAKSGRVNLHDLERELRKILFMVKDGELFTQPRFAGIGEPLRKVTDIAFSGDGEPTTYAHFKDAVELVIAAKNDAGIENLKIVLITNSTMLHRAGVKQALSLLDQHNGEIWAKLDAGTEPYYQRADATAVPFKRILDNLLDAARLRPIVIQSLFMRLHGIAPDAGEIIEYCNRLREIVANGGQIKLVQVHTIARKPAEPFASALSDQEVDAVVARVRSIPLPAAAFYSAA